MSDLKLFPYQLTGVEWLKTRRVALLGDQMGLGKTAQIIRAADALNLRKILIVCPSIARITWAREFAKWSLIKNRKIEIMTKRNSLPADDAEVVICTFDYATHRFLELGKTKRELLIVDESHYLKSLESKRTKAVFSRQGLVRSCIRTWLATGTPMPNHPGEMWSFLYTFGATTLNFESFKEKFCNQYEFNGRLVPTGAKRAGIPALKEMLDLVMLRRLTKDVLVDLPTATVSELPIEAELEKLSPGLKEQFDELEKFLGYNPSGMSPIEQLSTLEALAGSISSLRRYCVMGKVKPVCDLVTEELENNSYDKILIFGVHREAIDEITKRLSKFNAVSIHGGISAKQRQINIDKFQTEKGCRVFCGNIQAAGTNITLTAASQVLFIEQAFVPGDNAQVIARALRIGQKNHVTVRIASLAGSVDEKVQSILSSKLRDILELMG